MDVTITEYSDFNSEWWGLEDGTILATNDETGSYWVKRGSEPPQKAMAPWLQS